MINLLKQLESAVKRQHRGGKKKKAKRKAKRRATPRKPKIVFRTRVRTVHVHHRAKAAKRSHSSVRRKSSKKRRAKKGGKLSKTEFLRRMALGRARAKRARKH